MVVDNTVSSLSSVLGPSSTESQNSTTSTNSATNTLRQQDFLKLMVAQLQNHDPFKTDATNGDFLSQMEHFSTNVSIKNTQASIDNLSASLQSNQALQASALVGRSVVVNSNSLSLGNDGNVNSSFTIPKGASNVTASIYSSTGQLIKTVNCGSPNAGNFNFVWNGTDQTNARLPAGYYQIQVSASVAGKSVSVPTMITANVDSVSLRTNGGGIKVNVAGVGAVSLRDIQQITI